MWIGVTVGTQNTFFLKIIIKQQMLCVKVSPHSIYGPGSQFKCCPGYEVTALVWCHSWPPVHNNKHVQWGYNPIRFPSSLVIIVRKNKWRVSDQVKSRYRKPGLHSVCVLLLQSSQLWQNSNTHFRKQAVHKNITWNWLCNFTFDLVVRQSRESNVCIRTYQSEIKSGKKKKKKGP